MSNHPDISIPLTPRCGYHIFNQGNEKRNIFFKHRNYGYFIDKYQEYMQGFVDLYAYCLLPNHFHLMLKVKSVEEIFLRAKAVGFRKVNSLFFRRYVVPWFFKPDAGGFGLTVLPIWKGTDIENIFSGKKDWSVNELVELLNLCWDPKQSTLPLDTHPHHLEELAPHQQLASYIVSERFRRFLLSYSKAINIQQNRTGSLFRKAFRRKWVPTRDDAKRVITYVHHNPIHHGFSKDYHLYGYSSYQEVVDENSSIIDVSRVIELFDGKEEFKSFSAARKHRRWEQEYFYIEDE